MYITHYFKSKGIDSSIVIFPVYDNIETIQVQVLLWKSIGENS